jgi:hypothetical protein
MPLVSLPPSAAQLFAHATLMIAFCFAVRCVIRLVLCALAVLASREALSGTPGVEDTAQGLRADSLAVLRLILSSLCPPRRGRRQ